MIEKFNFYDVYGYFLPGAALIAVLWLPFGLVAHIWPTGDWSSALVGVALAYLVGHPMLYVSTNVIPSYDVKKSVPGKERYPSATLLDADSTDFPNDLREKIATTVSREFQLEVHTEDSAGDYDGNRNAAFFLARQRLIRDKAASYAEQFQGMYSLTRGLVIAFAAGTAYYFGWVLSVIGIPLVGAYALLFVSLPLLPNLAVRLWWEQNHQAQRNKDRQALSKAEQKRLRTEDRKREKRLQQYFAIAALLTFFAAGCVIGSGYDMGGKTCAWLVLAVVAASVALFCCYMQYRSFTFNFASTIWRDFTACAQSNAPGKDCRMQFE